MPWQTKALISYLPERTYLNDWMKVQDLLHFFADFYQDFDLERARQMLQNLQIDDKQKLKTMSKGTKEKVQLILVMSRRAQLYLLDEPIGGVDPAARDYILSTILKNFDENSSILISTHLIHDVETIFDQVLFLDQGKIVINGQVDEIRELYGKSIDGMFRDVLKCEENCLNKTSNRWRTPLSRFLSRCCACPSSTSCFSKVSGLPL